MQSRSSVLRLISVYQSAATVSHHHHPTRTVAIRTLSNFQSNNYSTLLTPSGREQALSRQPLLYSNLRTRHASYSTKRKSAPINTIINFVPQQEAWVIERFGKFSKVLEPGINILLPIVDQIRYVHSLKELALDIPSQSAITQDNVTLNLDGVLYLKVNDPQKASYGVEDPEYAVKQLAQTTMRSEIGMMKLDDVFKERASLNAKIVEAINSAASVWGITCLRYEIRDIQLPKRVIASMQMQVAAERQKRATVLNSEGVRDSEINVAEGKKRAQILSSEATKQEKINLASGEAEAIIAKATATAEGLLRTAKAIEAQGGNSAVAFSIAQKYVEAFSQIAKTGTTVLLPSNASDPASMISQALAVFNSIQHSNNNVNAITSNATTPTAATTTTDDKSKASSTETQLNSETVEFDSVDPFNLTNTTTKPDDSQKH